MIRFWSKVDKSGSCWIWTASRQKAGYGKFYFNGRLDGANRVAWILTYGVIPDGLHVLHSCDNPPCVNPKHLFLGNRIDNMQDCASKGRNGSQTHPERLPRGAEHFSKTQPEKVLKGIRNGRAKLTEADVLAARAAHSEGTTAKDLARQYGVNPTTMQDVVNRKHRRHLP